MNWDSQHLHIYYEARKDFLESEASAFRMIRAIEKGADICPGVIRRKIGSLLVRYGRRLAGECMATQRQQFLST